ncbi:hypothetical protein BDV33DRAFT_185098, partial [Aspergillus novoparasiticus]
ISEYRTAIATTASSPSNAGKSPTSIVVIRCTKHVYADANNSQSAAGRCSIPDLPVWSCTLIVLYSCG